MARWKHKAVWLAKNQWQISAILCAGCLALAHLIKLHLVQVPALGLVRALGREQHLLLRLVLILLLPLPALPGQNVQVPALPVLLKGCRRNFMCRRLLCQFWNEGRWETNSNIF